MPRVIHVKKARKDNPCCKKGESYYHWTPFRSSTRYSKTYPRASQTCGGKKSQIYAAQEQLEDGVENLRFVDADQANSDLETIVQECCESFREIGEEYTDGVQNMPEGLQQGEQAMNMEEMAGSLECAADSLESVEIECDIDKADHTDDDDDEFDEEGYLEECQSWLDGVGEELMTAAQEVEILF